MPGPFDRPHFYLQFGGKLPGDEEWSCGLRLMNAASTANPAHDESLLSAAETAVTNFWTSAGIKLSPRAKLSFVKLNAIGTDGRYIESVTHERVIADIGAGGGATSDRGMPNQVALAASLTTGFSRGTAHRGRIYLPLPAITVGADGRIDAADSLSVANSVKSLITALNAMSANYKVAVMSRKLPTPGHRAVTGVEVGHVLDTQRRRRRSLLEAYTAAA